MAMIRSFGPLSCALMAVVVSGGLPSRAQTDKTAFSRDVAPVFARKCAQCHSPASSMANLDLSTREAALKGGQHGPAIVPGDAAASRLYRHLTGREQPQMPLGGRLTDLEVAVIKSWIDGGAVWESGVVLAPPAAEKTFTDAQRKYWAFQKVVKP